VESSETDASSSVSFGDYDNDGDLDQLVGNYAQKNRIYKSEYSLKKMNNAPDPG